MTNKLYFGDNLEVLRQKFPGEQGYFDLIYLDPPFNSSRNYNVLFREGKVDSSAQIHAFEDTWEWTDATIKLFNDLKENPNPQIAILIDSLHEFLSDTPMMAYLVNMTARLIPLRRVLKDTGSIYLHCDPTASHYLKVVMDVVLGKQNFKNEIVWSYKRWPAKQKGFQKMHDIILLYVKDIKQDFIFNELFQPLAQSTLQAFGGKKQIADFSSGHRKPGILEIKSPGAPMSDVWEIGIIAPISKERLGYPTQKPEKLLERIILASSNEGDLILDPFCGCGTTVAVAERLKRNWVGIDISMQAINVISHRMRAHYPGVQIDIDGIPKDYAAAQAMAAEDKFAFQDWAITLVDANPPSGETKKGADRGIDGLILFREPASFEVKNPRLRKILVQVKGGAHGRRDISTLKGDIDRDDAPMGIFICINEPSSEMNREAALAGEYKYSDSVSFPKIQILSVKDWFEGRNIKLPSTRVNPFRIAEAKADQSTLNL